jgi:hypothetical protein
MIDQCSTTDQIKKINIKKQCTDVANIFFSSKKNINCHLKIQCIYLIKYIEDYIHQ